MSRSRFTLASAGLPLALLLLNAPANAQDSHYAPHGSVQQFAAPDCFIEKGAWEGGSRPCTAKDFDAWLADLAHWRAERKIRIGYSDQRYALPEFKWTQSAFMQPQMMVQDRYFYDPVAGKYTVDRLP
jgi:gamma-glutamyl hercynylcysteine S-oxide synthase